MCGIVGYVGDRDVVSVLLDGLSKLEYRGYDSAGVAYLGKEGMKVVKAKGRLENLQHLLEGVSVENTIGIGHTRWATHGEPSNVNSHPHTNVKGDIAVVHNGIIENYAKLKEWLKNKGVCFISDTDTEVIAHLVNYFYDGDLRIALMKTVKMLEGSYAIAVVSTREPDKVVAVRKDSPLVVGVGDGESLIASDIPALLRYTKYVYFLEENETVVLKKDEVRIYDQFGTRVEKELTLIDWDVSQAEKGGYEHFMMKEIHEQPRALYDTLMPRLKDGRLDLSEMCITEDMMRNVSKITMVACGTAYHAACIGKYALEALARVPVEVDIASEFRYRDPIFMENQLVVVVSQSGETADTIAAMREAKRHGVKVAAIVNVKGSTIAREANAVFYTNAGMEMAVASTKAYTTQVLAMYMLALEFARARGTITEDAYMDYIQELSEIPRKAEEVIANKAVLQKFASERFMEQSAFFIGRGLDYALAMEGSLKLKEISYIHSEAYAAGELKHGTIALIEQNTLVIAMCTQSALAEKMASNIEEVRSRGAFVFAIVQNKDAALEEVCDKVVFIPNANDMFAPILAIIPAQLFAYYMSVSKGCDVDKPRNLAKSVTVE